VTWKTRLRNLEKALGPPPPPPPPPDAVEFCRRWLGYEPYDYVKPFLRDQSHFIALLMARQTGKTFNGMAKLLHIAASHPHSTILVTAPKFDQVKQIAFKHLHNHLERMRQANPTLYRGLIPPRGAKRTIIRLRNGSEILAESPVPETIRGHTAKAVYLMEANFIRDDQDLYTAVLFTLNTTNGYLIAESTPWNTDSVFHQIFHSPHYQQFSLHRVPYHQALHPRGPLTPTMVDTIKQQLQGDPHRWAREMLCQWTESQDKWLPICLITHCQDSQLSYWKPTQRHRGEFHAGVDFGKKHDYTVVAVLQAKGRHHYLRHLHRFPLDTPYGVVIGYLRRLQDNWSHLSSIRCDATGVGDYIVEDMERSGLRGVQGVVFTQASKESLATALRELMLSAECPNCGWTGTLDTGGGRWNTNCPRGCRTQLGNPQKTRGLLHLPYDPQLYTELNTPTYTLNKGGTLVFNHPAGTHDDAFWALALAVRPPPQTSKPRAKTKRPHTI